MIISDLHISIKERVVNNAIREVFPWALHGLYGFYMKQNVKNKFKNDKVTTIFDHPSRGYHTLYFDN